MKRLYTLLVLFSALTMGAYAQDVYTDDPDDPVIAQFRDYGAVAATDSIQVQQDEPAPSKPKESFRDRWTLGVKGGITYFSLWKSLNSPIITESGDKFGVGADISHAFAFFTEYNFDYGLGVGAYFGNSSFNRYHALGSSIEFGLYGHFNLLENAVWTQAPAIARRFHFFWDVGLGVGALWQLNQLQGYQYSDSVFWRCSAVIRTALQFEFMIRPNWGIFIEGEYRGYGRGREESDQRMQAAQWINSGAISGGLRFYFDTREKEHDPRLNEDDFPISKPKEPHYPAPKNAFYINVSLTPEMIEEARENNGVISTQASEMGSVRPGVQVVPMKQSQEVASALKVLEEQGVGTVLINSVRFANEQLTDESMLILDKVAGSLMTNRLWQRVDLLYMCDKQASSRAAVIAAYLRAKGIKNLTVKGFDTKSNDATSDLIITIK